MQVWKIDINNFYVGESYFAEKPSEKEITTPITIGYVKPKWTGAEWVEGATEQEIQEWKEQQSKIPKEPTELDLLKEENAQLKTRLQATEQIAFETSSAQQELLELLIDMGVI